MAQSTILVQLPLFPKSCADCGLPITGRNRKYCAACAEQRRKQTNALYWARVAAGKPDLMCVTCGVVYKARSGGPSLRDYCQPCALIVRAAKRKAEDRARPHRRDRARARLYSHRYKADHPEWNRAQSARYKKRHPEKVREQVNRRRARRESVPGDISITAFWMLCDDHGWHCHYCQRPLTRRSATMDHVIPLGRPGSSNDVTNIVPACRSCNASKYTKTLDEWAGPPSLRIRASVVIPKTD